MKITQRKGDLTNLKLDIDTFFSHPQVKLLPKQGTFLSRKTRQANQPFETTFRLQVSENLKKNTPNSHYFYTTKKIPHLILRVRTKFYFFFHFINFFFKFISFLL